MKKTTKSLILRVGVLSVLILAVALMGFAFSRTVDDISETVVARTPTAILASAGIKDATPISVPVTYYDQKADECVDIYDVTLEKSLEKRQFEWTECGYYTKQLEQGLVDFELRSDFLPVGNRGELLPNRGLVDLTRWFSEVQGKSKSYAGVIKLNYNANGAVFSLKSSEFYPLDEVEFSKGDYVNKDGHNHLFTMNFAVPFTALLSGDEEFTIKADDDTFVFVGDKLVLDMGGIHEPITGRFTINKEGEVYASVDGENMAFSGVKLASKEGTVVRIFHADRDSAESVLEVSFEEMSLSVTESKIAFDGSVEGEVQVAYDPTNPSYVAPLGESKRFQPDRTNGLLIIATIEGFSIIALSLFLMVVVRFFIRRD